MATYNVDKLAAIDLGRQGENLARTIQIDVSSMLNQWPEAAITLLVKRKHDTNPYVANTSVVDGVLLWPITAADTEVAGDGKIEIRATCGEVIAKSAIGTIRVVTSLTGSETEPPDAVQSWVDAVIAAGTQALAGARDAQAAIDAVNAARDAAQGYAEDAQTAADDARASATLSQNNADASLASAASATTSENRATQAMTDLLRMLGTDVATLVNGKIPVEQIPALATTEVYHAADADEMAAIEAERGDICIRTDEDKSYVYDGGWVYLSSPTDYASRAGHAETARTAQNAVTINGHRLVEISESEWENAVKDPDTYYLIYSESEEAGE